MWERGLSAAVHILRVLQGIFTQQILRPFSCSQTLGQDLFTLPEKYLLPELLFLWHKFRWKMSIKHEPSTAAGFAANYREYPLNFNCTDLDVEDLRLYHEKLERKSASLFLESSTNCQVELWHPELDTGEGQGGTSSLACELTFASLKDCSYRDPPVLLNSIGALETFWKVKLFYFQKLQLKLNIKTE